LRGAGGYALTEANTDEAVRVQEKRETKKAPPSPAGLFL